MTYAPNADKFEVGKQYIVSSTYRGINARRLTVGATVTVFKVETLEEAGFQSDIDNLDTFCTIIVKDGSGDRFYVKASDLELNGTSAIRSWKPAAAKHTVVAPKPEASLAPAQENERLHDLFDKMDKWNAQGLDQWGLPPVRWDLIR